MIRLHSTKLSSYHYATPTAGNGVVVGDRVYFCGFPKTFLPSLYFSLKNNSWKEPDVPQTRRFGSASTLVDDKIFIYGGKFFDQVWSTQLLSFDLLSYETTKLPTRSPGPRRSRMSEVWIASRREIVYFGGMESSDNTRSGAGEPTNKMNILNVDSLIWREPSVKGRLPPRRSHHSAVLIGTDMLIYGGFQGYQQYLNDMYVASMKSVESCSWSQILMNGWVPEGRLFAPVVYLKGMLILYGGRLSLDFSNDVCVYDLETNEWKSSKGRDVELEGKVNSVRLRQVVVKHTDRLLGFASSGVYQLRFID